MIRQIVRFLMSTVRSTCTFAMLGTPGLLLRRNDPPS